MGARHPRRPRRAPADALELLAELLERSPAGVDSLLVVLVRLEVEIAAADGAQSGALVATEDLLGQCEREGVARPGGEIDLIIVDVRRAQLFVGLRAGG